MGLSEPSLLLPERGDVIVPDLWHTIARWLEPARKQGYEEPFLERHRLSLELLVISPLVTFDGLACLIFLYSESKIWGSDNSCVPNGVIMKNERIGCRSLAEMGTRDRVFVLIAFQRHIEKSNSNQTNETKNEGEQCRPCYERDLIATRVRVCRTDGAAARHSQAGKSSAIQAAQCGRARLKSRSMVPNNFLGTTKHAKMPRACCPKLSLRNRCPSRGRRL